MHDWDRVLESIRNDRIHGSSQLYRILLEVLIQRCESLSQNSQISSDLPPTIAILRPEMACFHFAARRLAQAVHADPAPAAVARLCRQLVDDQTQAHSAVARNLWPLVTECRAVMLHSNSGLLEHAVAEVFTRETTIYVSEGRPDNEGITLAHKLAAEHFQVKVFPDDARTSLLSEVEVVLLGADWIAEQDFTNKVGTHTMCRFAQSLEIPVYVLADTTKFASARLRPQRRDSEMPLAAGISLIQRRFEETPNRLITGFITESAILTAAQVASQVETAGRTS